VHKVLNPSRNAEVIVQNKVARFYGPQCSCKCLNRPILCSWFKDCPVWNNPTIIHREFSVAWPWMQYWYLGVFDWWSLALMQLCHLLKEWCETSSETDSLLTCWHCSIATTSLYSVHCHKVACGVKQSSQNPHTVVRRWDELRQTTQLLSEQVLVLV